jgi:hypothetical protein
MYMSVLTASRKEGHRLNTNTRKANTCFLTGALVMLMFSSLAPASAVAAEKFKSPDVLILGDSQFTFGSGPTFVDFFRNIKTYCSPDATHLRELKKLDYMSVAAIGVRSSSLPSWTARSTKGKGAICDIDPKWKVNAGAYGSVNKTDNEFVQIGQGKPYQFCKKNKSPFEALFQNNYYDPKLLVMSFLGNSTKDWANSPAKALTDVQRTMRQLPKDLPCIFITSAPSYKKTHNDLRLRAQNNLKKAFRDSGSRCSFVEGLTPKTISANVGNKSYFRRNKSGGVKDPYHPNDKAAKRFFKIERQQICSAVFTQLSK